MTLGRRPIRAFLVIVALVSVACGDQSPGSESQTTTADAPAGSGPLFTVEVEPEELSGTVTVAAAASLRAAFDDVAGGFTAENPEVDVVLNYDSSSTLAAQVLEGAPADVFASADLANMTELTDAGRIDGEPRTFVRNQLVIVTKPGNPVGITGLADLVDVGVVSLCGSQVPCGRYATEALELSEVTIDESSVTRGPNAAATLTAVTDGDAVAGIVYVTDALAAGSAVHRVDLPAGVDVAAEYPIAVLAGARHLRVAQAFVDYTMGTAGQAVLAEYGFLHAP